MFDHDAFRSISAMKPQNVLIPLAMLLLAGCSTRPITVEEGRHVPTPPPRPTDLPKPVEAPVFLPKPEAARKPDVYSVVVYDVPVREVLFALARDAKLNLDVHPLVAGQVTLNAINQNLQQILDRVAKQVDMRYTLEGNQVSVEPDTPYIKTYRVDYVNVARITNSQANVSTSVDSIGSSSTGVVNRSENIFWERMGKNLRDLLVSTRKVREELRRDRETKERKEEEKKAELEARMRGEPSPTEKRKADAQKEREEARKDAEAARGNSQSLALIQQRAESTASGGGAATGGAAAAPAAAAPGAEQASTKELENDVYPGWREQITDKIPVASQNVFVHPETGTVTVSATAREHEKVQEYLAMVGQGSQRQVLIEATIVEVSLNDQYQAGVDWNLLKRNADGSSQDNRLTILQNGNTLNPLTPFTTLTYSKAASSILKGADFAATVRLLEQFGKTKILSSPRLMALNNQTAIMKVVEDYVYFTLSVTPGTPTTTTGTTVTPGTPPIYTSTRQTVPIGIIMSITPQISEDGEITMNVRPTITSLAGEKQDPAIALNARAVTRVNGDVVEIPPNLVPVLQTREVESVLKLSNGQVAVLGGLIKDELKNKRSGLPGLSRLPFGIGDAFSYRDDVMSKTELVIFMRPQVVREASLDGDLKAFRAYQPEKNFFERPEDELSAFKTGLPVR